MIRDSPTEGGLKPCDTDLDVRAQRCQLNHDISGRVPPDMEGKPEARGSGVEFVAGTMRVSAAETQIRQKADKDSDHDAQGDGHARIPGLSTADEWSTGSVHTLE